MSSPVDIPYASSSPTAVSGSPLRHRRSQDSGDAPARHSPTLTRQPIFDPNDPTALERQRTMDAGMAMHLSRARRETVSAGTGASPGSGGGTVSAPNLPVVSQEPISTLSPIEQHELELASGLSPTDEDALSMTEDDDTPLPKRVPSLLNLDIHSNQDPSLLVGASQQSITGIGKPDNDSAPFILPTYQLQDTTSGGTTSAFDFSPMEEFSRQEKHKLGLNSPPPTARFDLSTLTAPRTSRKRKASPAMTALESQSQSPDPLSSEPPTTPPGPSSPSSDPNLTPRPRQRKLSQSNSPRPHRKGIGGKMAAFEANPSTFDNLNLSGRLGSILGNAGGQHPDGTPGSVTAGTALNTGHDRPYRFTFYSNALPSTIHARSLSELPAEGQSFRDLFNGVPPPSATFNNAADTLQPGGGVGNGNGKKDRPASVHSQWRNAPSTTKNGVPSGAGAAGAGGYFPPPKLPAQSGMGGMGGLPGPVQGQEETEGSTWWLDVTSPTEEEMKMLSQVFLIHPLTTEDILMEETREKIELFRTYYLVCFRSFDQDPYSPTHLEPLNMYIIVFREGTLSFHFRATPHPQSVRRRIKQLKDYISVTSDWISYALIDDITDAFGPLIQSIEYEVDSIDELVLILKEAEQSDMLRRIGTCRKKVMGLLRLMGNKADVVKGLAKRCNENWRVAPTSDIGLYLSDIQDHLITMTQNLNHYEKILSRSHSNYLAQISIEMTDANNQINDVLSKLTALGTVLIPMNLITGLWGMNVHVPGQDVDVGYAWFGSIIGCLAFFAISGGYLTYRFMVKR